MKVFDLHRPFAKRNLLFAALALLLLSFISSFYFHEKPSVALEKRRIERYLAKQQESFNRFLSDTDVVRKLLHHNESKEELQSVCNEKYGIFLFTDAGYSQHELRFWNTQKILPPQDILQPDGEYLQKQSTGYVVVVKRTLQLSNRETNHVVAYAVIPVQYQFIYEIPELRPHFAHDPGVTKQVTISETKTGDPVQLGGKPLFYLQKGTYTPITSDTLTIILRIAALVLFLVYVHLVAEEIYRRIGSVKAIGFFALVLLAVRLVLYGFSNIFYFRQFPLFDPHNYAASVIHPSLGDLLINAILYCWLVLFAWFTIGPVKRLPRFLSGKRRMIAGWIALFLYILSTFLLADVVRSLVADSTISFSVTEFFSLTIYTVVGFIVLAVLSLSYYYFSRLLFRFIFPVFEKQPILIYFILALIGLLFLTLPFARPGVSFHLPVLAWLLAFTFLLSQEQFLINRFRVTLSGVLFWIFIFSASLAAIILHENRKKEWNNRKLLAERYGQVNQMNNETILSIATAYLDNDFLSTNFWRFSDPVQSQLVRDSIVNASTLEYVKNFDTRIFVYDSSGDPLNNTHYISYAEWDNIFRMHSRPIIGVPGTSYHQSAFDRYSYITRRVITDSTGTMGILFMVSIPKRFYDENLKPDLFRRTYEKNVENSSVYKIAVYDKGILVGSSSKYAFPISLTPDAFPRRQVEKRVYEDNDELWYKASTQKVVVIAKKQDTLIESITLFSYLFCAFLLMVALVQVVALFLKASGNVKIKNVFWQLNIRSQVHGTIIFVSVLSFIIIGIATISFFINRYNQNNTDKLNRTALIMVQQMREALVQQDQFDDEVTIHNQGPNSELQREINQIAEIHNVDVNVYDTSGNLTTTSQQEVYSKGVLSLKMHPLAFYQLKKRRVVQYVQKENLSSLKYLSMYYAVRDDNGAVRAYINVPYFLSQYELNQEISNFLVTIINLNAFIFLVAGVIALIITNKITRSFSVIGDKMKQIRLGKSNEEIEWNRNDEIGALILQYNKMVQQLEQSAEALAKSEREGAWREMARQVAHEIKNPLTPMKLSIQYLQKAIANNQPNVKELTTNVATTLVEQIDHLSKIAADFSQFANIGNRNLEVFDLHQVIEGLKDLYSTYPNVEIRWRRVEDEIPVEADKTHINRLFANLLANAVDACAKNDQCRIEINETLHHGSVLIEIKDNGEGIAPEMQPKIFTPNFTTKSSGTGLGLAMCKSIVEQADGEIWFTTAPGKGTSFFIKLPTV